MLVNLVEILKLAEEKKCAVGAFNTPNLECVNAVIDAAEKLDVPVIISHAELHEEVSPLYKIGPVMVQAAKAVCLKNLGSVKADYMAGIIKNWLSRGMTSVHELENTGRKSVSADAYESSIDTEAWTDMVEKFDPDMLYENDE